MNVERNLPVIRERKLAILKGDPELCAQQKKAGKLLARERIAQLLDAASFVELDVLNADAGVVTGYGLVAGALDRRLPKNLGGIYASLVGAMVAGRVVWGVVRALLTLTGNTQFSFAAFIAGAFTSAIPGILLQLVAIPVVVVALQKARLIPQAA